MPKPTIAIVGPGRLGTALGKSLASAGYRVAETISRNSKARLTADIVWFCVPDREIAAAARQLADHSWKGKVALHSSGVLASTELSALKKKGAAIASVHPLMTFVTGSIPSLRDVPFAIEGDAGAVRVARRIVRDLGGHAMPIQKRHKQAYHTWGAFTSPLLIALLASAEQVASSAGLSARQARKNMLPIIRQTLENYLRLGPAGAFSGPIVRGDVATVRKHLQVLKKTPAARAAYVALARAAIQSLPAENRKQLERLLRTPRT